MTAEGHSRARLARSGFRDVDAAVEHAGTLARHTDEVDVLVDAAARGADPDVALEGLAGIADAEGGADLVPT